MVLSPVELMHGSKFCLNCVLYGHIYILCTLALGMLIPSGFWLLFSNFRFIWCLFDMTSCADTFITYHDLARIWRNKDVIAMVMLPFPLSYYHFHYTIFNIFPIQSVIHDSI